MSAAIKIGLASAVALHEAARLAAIREVLAPLPRAGRFCEQWSENGQQSYAPHDYLPRPP
jgi:P2-related tail formation protein